MKTIKKLQIIVIVFVLLAANYAFAGGNVDVKKSTVHWKGAKVTGEHNGTINIKEGELSLNNGEIKGGKIIMDMNSIVDLDLESKEWNEKLIDHLKSDDFFSVDTYPTATLVLTNVCAQHEHEHTFVKALNKFEKYKFSDEINISVA